MSTNRITSATAAAAKTILWVFFSFFFFMHTLLHSTLYSFFVPRFGLLSSFFLLYVFLFFSFFSVVRTHIRCRLQRCTTKKMLALPARGNPSITITGNANRDSHFFLFFPFAFCRKAGRHAQVGIITTDAADSGAHTLLMVGAPLHILTHSHTSNLAFLFQMWLPAMRNYIITIAVITESACCSTSTSRTSSCTADEKWKFKIVRERQLSQGKERKMKMQQDEKERKKWKERAYYLNETKFAYGHDAFSLSLSFFLHCWCRCCDRAFARVQVPKEAVSSSAAAPTRRHGHSAVGTFLKVCFQTASEAAAAAKTLCKLVCLRRGYGPALIEWFVTIVIVAARQQPSKMLACLLHGSLFPSSSSTNHRISLSVFFCRIDLSRWFCRNYCTACCTSSAFSFRQCCCAIVFVNPDHTLTAGHSSLFHCFVFFFFDGTGCADASITAAFCLFFSLFNNRHLQIANHPARDALCLLAA